MKIPFAILVLPLVMVSCSDPRASREVVGESPGSAPPMESVPFDTWTEVATDYPAVVAAAGWAGGSPDTIRSARVRVTENLEYFEITRRSDDEMITERIARHRWKVLEVPDDPGELGRIAPNLSGKDYQLLNRSTVRIPATIPTDL